MWIEGVTDMITVASSHALVMRSPEVADLVLGFLANGFFGDEPAGRVDAVAAACAASEDHQDPATP
jgi:hypothetical protein